MAREPNLESADREADRLGQALQRARVQPNDWRDRTDLSPILEDLRRFTINHPQRAEQLWDRFVPGDLDKPVFLNSRDGGQGTRAPEATGRAWDEQGLSPIERQLRKRYLHVEGRYHFRQGTQAVAFEDRGQSISTSTDDPDVIGAIVALAQARQWLAITVRGSDEFRRQAWLEAASRGILVDGYQPRDIDLVQLREREAEKNREPRARNAVSALSGAEPEIPMTRRENVALQSLQAMMRERGDSEAAIERATSMAAEMLRRERSVAGTVIELGRAHYEHDPQKSMSYFVRIATPHGERSVWGKELEPALAKAGIGRGALVAIAYQGRESVEVTEPIRDAAGNTVQTRIKSAYRNQWTAVNLDRLEAGERERIVASSNREPEVRVWDHRAPARPQRQVETPARIRDRERAR